MTATIPELDLDLFADASLRDPVSDYRTVRDAGPVVRLARLDVFAMARFHNVQAALRAADVLISGEGVGFSDSFNASKGSNVLQTDGELHRRMRAAVTRPLTPATLSRARDDLKARIAERVATLTGTGWFEAMADLASFLPVEAVSHLVGLPEVGRGRMLEWAAATFNLIGPKQDPANLASLADAFQFLSSLTPASVAEGSWSAGLFAAAEAGKLSPREALGAISAYVIPSLDTTILAKGHLLHNLANHREQWAMVRANPALIPGAVLESVRHSSVLRWFSRVATQDYEVEGATIPAGARVMLLYGAANRDERRYTDPDRFDVTRDARDHLAWGTGPHMCAGMNLARIEMEVLLEALVEAHVALTGGVAEPGNNAGLFGLYRLPLRLDPITAGHH